MPLPQNTTQTEAYRNIADITGLDFKSGSLEDVNSALNQIYIDGTNIFAVLGISALNSVDNTNIKQISRILNQALSATEDTYSFVSVMNPDDPTVVPRMISNKTLKDERGRDISSADREKAAQAKAMQQKKNKAAKTYESNFKKTHQQKLAELNESLSKNVTAPGEFRNGTNLFSRNFLDPAHGQTRKPVVLKELKDNLEAAVDMCNLILLNRGYTMEELAGKGINAEEGRKEIGSKMEEFLISPDMEQLIIHPEIAEKREADFRNFVDEAFAGLEKLSFKPVDLSDDKTLDNVKDNRVIATMADSLKQILQSAQKDLKYDWLPQAVENAINITNFTDGVMALDVQRIKASQSATRNEETVAMGVTAQAYVDSLGPNYKKYRTTDIRSAKNEMSMVNVLDAALPKALSEEQQTKEQQALGQAVSKNKPQEYRRLVTEQVRNSETLTAAKNHVDIAASNTAIMKQAEAAGWYTEGLGANEQNYKATLSTLFTRNSQFGRGCTVATLFMMHAAWEAEKNGQSFDIKAYMKDPKQQSEAAEKAFAFFQEHPITEEVTEQSKANSAILGQITASFYRNMHEMEVPEFHWDSADEAANLKNFTRDFKTILQDSEQLRDLVPPHNDELSNIFYEQFGGKEAYEALKARNGIAGLTMTAENDLLNALDDLESKSLDYLYGNSSKIYNMRQLAVSSYFLTNLVDPVLGRKIKDLPANEALSSVTQAFNQNGVNSKSFENLYKVAEDPAKTRENQRKLMEYVTSGGKKDELGVKEAFNKCAETQKAQFQLAYPDEIIPTMSEAIAEMNKKPLTEEEKKAQQEKQKREQEEAKRKAEADAKEAAAKAAEEAKKAEEAARRAAEEKQRAEQQAKEEAAKKAETRELRELENNAPHDWSAEIPEADWKARLELMDKKLAEKDPALLKSSAEYKAAREGLQAALKALNAPGGMDKKAFNESMDKVFHNAGNYIDKKENGKVGKYYGQDRLDAMRDIRGMLANRNTYAMKPSGIAEIFGVGDTYTEKLESGFLRLGAYLNEAEVKKLTDPKESKEMIDLVERVLAERGKDHQTRNELKKKMALQDAELFDDKAQLLDDSSRLREAKNAVMKVMRSKTSMTETAANWFGVMNAYEEMADLSKSDIVKKSGKLKNVREVAMCGRLAQKVMETRYKAMDFDAPERLTKQEATEMVAFASLGEFMRHPDSTEHIKVFNTFMNENDSEAKLLKNFAEQNTVKKLCEKQGREAINHIAGRTAQQSIGKLGMVELTENLRVENQKRQEAILKAMNKTLAVSPEQLKQMNDKTAQNVKPDAKKAPENKMGEAPKKKKIQPGIQRKLDELNKAAKLSAGRGLH